MNHQILGSAPLPLDYLFYHHFKLINSVIKIGYYIV